MSIFTKVPGFYNTRGGGFVWVKFIGEPMPNANPLIPDYPVIGCKASKRADGTLEWLPNIMFAYALCGRCVVGKDQADDIVGFACERVVMYFTGGHPDHDRPVLTRHGHNYLIARFYADWTPGRQWSAVDGKYRISDDGLEWAELP